MKVALFSESYRPVVNGVTRSIDLLVEALQQRGHTPVVYAPGASLRQPAEVEDRPFERRFPAFRFPTAPDYPLAVPFSPRLFREFRRSGFDLVHLQTPFALGFCGLMLSRWQHRPVIAHLHTLYLEYLHYVPVPDFILRPLTVWYLRWFYSQADSVIAPSPSVVQFLREIGVKRPIEVIPTGVRLTPAPGREEGRRAFDIPSEAALLLYTGRLAREKNLLVLMEAFCQISQEIASARLLLLGEGPIRSELELLARERGIADRIGFAGLRSPDEVRLASAAADLFLFPSVTDTQALSVLEAMACGVPPIVANAFGPADLVQDGVSGRVVAPTAEALATAAIRLIQSDSERERLGAGARQRAMEFSADAIAERILQLYRSVLASRDTPESPSR